MLFVIFYLFICVAIAMLGEKVSPPFANTDLGFRYAAFGSDLSADLVAIRADSPSGK